MSAAAPGLHDRGRAEHAALLMHYQLLLRSLSARYDALQGCLGLCAGAPC